MKVKSKKKLNVFTSFLILSTLVIINSTLTTALDPGEVDVVIRFKQLDYFYIDGDLGSAGDVYFKIYHQTGTHVSGTATNDYEDWDDPDLSNADFDGNGYYNQQYWNVDLDTGDLTWNIEVWDEDWIGDDLLFKGLLTVKNPGTTGSYSSTAVNAYGHWVWYDSAWVPLFQEFSNSYLKFEWIDGPVYTGATKTSNGLTLWVSLYYTT